jgi:hypothetical protein
MQVIGIIKFDQNITRSSGSWKTGRANAHRSIDVNGSAGGRRRVDRYWVSYRQWRLLGLWDVEAPTFSLPIFKYEAEINQITFCRVMTQYNFVNRYVPEYCNFNTDRTENLETWNKFTEYLRYKSAVPSIEEKDRIKLHRLVFRRTETFKSCLCDRFSDEKIERHVPLEITQLRYGPNRF